MKKRVRTGIEGFDEILEGGLLPERSYLIKGGPGAGKSTFTYHFLEEGNRQGEETLLISLNEKKENILESAKILDIDLSDSHILDLSPSSELFAENQTYNVFSSTEVEQKPLFENIRKAINEHQPSRVGLDSITMLNMLASDSYQARTLALSLIRYICDQGATLLMISEQTKKFDESSFWLDGIVNLMYDENWRNIEVVKFRGSDFQKGRHTFKITESGITVFPKLRPSKYDRKFTNKQLGSGITKLDDMLSGGLERGTTTLLTGPSGIGKTNLGIHFIRQAAINGERSAIYSFEESKEVIMRRSKGISIPIEEMIEQDKLKVASIEPLSYSPDEFSKIVRQDVEENDTRIVMIDAIGGYELAVGEKNALTRMHSLCVYLQNMGVTTILVNETSNIFGKLKSTEIKASYLADNILFLRYMETEGRLDKLVGILKKRLSDFDKYLRQYKITSDGIIVGDKLEDMQGLLTGVPNY